MEKNKLKKVQLQKYKKKIERDCEREKAKLAKLAD